MLVCVFLITTRKYKQVFAHHFTMSYLVFAVYVPYISVDVKIIQ